MNERVQLRPRTERNEEVLARLSEALAAMTAERDALAHEIRQLNTLSLTAQQKVDAAIRRQTPKLQNEFDQCLQQSLKEALETTVLPSLRKREQRAFLIERTRRGIMNRATYRKIWACLHPDRVLDVELKERYAEAFNLFQKLEVVLLNEKEDPSPAPAMATTYEELRALRLKAQEERRAKRSTGKSVGVR
jgi:hypothetical protein